jgi:hypothetical protein
MEPNIPEPDWKAPNYVLMNMVTKRVIGWYAMSEADILEKDALQYCYDHNLERRDLGVAIDKLGYNVPKINETEDWL